MGPPFDRGLPRRVLPMLAWLAGSIGPALSADASAAPAGPPGDGVECARAGDVVIYRSADISGKFMISRSGVVDAMDGCTVLRIRTVVSDDAGSNGCAGGRRPGREITTDPDAAEIAGFVTGAGEWVVLHSDRPSHDNALKKLRNVRIGKTRKLVSVYLTDKGTAIVGLPERTSSGKPAGNHHDCHGYTFAKSESAIVGWFDQHHWHLDAAAIDQGSAVQIILDDNGYRKVHAKDRRGVDHY